ncbi:hypothetical protein DWX59_27190 [Enterocloster aldenensis]|uniref:hypothetical protein n=1 Tax=Enterocloster aldenensis TaxID=358742 RepID=UPI000E41263B|nr:hypothetical protein DWX59_27190 [Enterocloster aldenensis]
MKKTAISIIAPQGLKNGYLIIFMEEQAYAEFLAGKDSSPVTAFNVVPSEKGEIVSMLIELQEGVPRVVTATVE